MSTPDSIVASAFTVNGLDDQQRPGDQQTHRRPPCSAAAGLHQACQ